MENQELLKEAYSLYAWATGTAERAQELIKKLELEGAKKPNSNALAEQAALKAVAAKRKRQLIKLNK